ncbi:beta strand repeat-containing protein [Streptomyces lydicus]|uniref:beta strand repeat-containing protein n=1 Tax=Streptomyces lydicus TaxID=47763 RepID=UPI0037B522B0
MAPVVTSVSPAQGAPAGGTGVIITGSGFTGATQVRFGPNGTTFVIVSDTLITARTPAGAGTVQVTVTAPTGTSTQNVLFTYTSAPAPTLSSLSPATGPTSGGNTVTLNGTNLSGATVVLFGPNPATVLTNTATQITVIAPAGSPSSVAVTVTTAGGTSNALTYTYVAAPVPVLSSLSPPSGPPSGGNTVALSGTGLSGATSVMFGANPATILTTSATQVTVIAPANTGTVNVTATTAGGTSNALPYAYTATPVPSLSSLTPTSGPTSGGNTVTLNGTNLTGATSVKFGANPATILTDTATQVTVAAPAGPPSSVGVTVTTAGGTSNPLPYFYLSAPTVSDLSPHLGPATGGNIVTVFGSNLTLTSAVTFGGNPATGIIVVSDSQLTVTAPAGSGTVAVTVTTPGGTSTAATGNPYYTYLGAPTLTSLTPAHGAELGGEAIVLGGSNLTYTDAVTFGGIPASFSAISDTQVVATSPGGAPGTVNVVAHTPAGNSNALPYVYDPS